MDIKASTNNIILGLIVLIGSFLRIFRIGSESLWLDEGYSVHFVTTMNMAELIFELPWIDNSPPLYYVLLDIWTVLFGYSELSIRLLSALFGIFTIIITYMIGFRLYSEKIGLLSAGILSISPFHIWYAQEARMYTLFALLASLSFLFFVKSLNNGNSSKYVALYVVFTVAVGYTHVFGLLIIFSQLIFLFIKYMMYEEKINKSGVVHWMMIQALVGVFLLPYLRILLIRMITGGGQVWIPIPPLNYIVTTPLSYFGTSFILQGNPIVTFGLLAFVGVLSIIAISPLVYQIIGRDFLIGSLSFDNSQEFDQTQTSLLLVLWVLTPIIVPIIISYTVTPIYALLNRRTAAR